MANTPEEPKPDLPVSAEEADYEQLLDDYGHLSPPHEGDLLQGHVLKVNEKEVIVDFGYKSEGLVPIEQFMQPDGSVTVQPGDTIDVMMDRQGIQPEGYTLLSHEKASKLRNWDNLEKAHREGLVLLGRVLGRIKGGLLVDVGVEAFMPGSQIDLRPAHNLDTFIGKDIPVKVVKVNRRRGNIVVSRKLAIEEDLVARKTAALADRSAETEIKAKIDRANEVLNRLELRSAALASQAKALAKRKAATDAKIARIEDALLPDIIA